MHRQPLRKVGAISVARLFRVLFLLCPSGTLVIPISLFTFPFAEVRKNVMNSVWSTLVSLFTSSLVSLLTTPRSLLAQSVLTEYFGHDFNFAVVFRLLLLIFSHMHFIHCTRHYLAFQLPLWCHLNMLERYCERQSAYRPTTLHHIIVHRNYPRLAPAYFLILLGGLLVDPYYYTLFSSLPSIVFKIRAQRTLFESLAAVTAICARTRSSSTRIAGTPTRDAVFRTILKELNTLDPWNRFVRNLALVTNTASVAAVISN